MIGIPFLIALTWIVVALGNMHPVAAAAVTLGLLAVVWISAMAHETIEELDQIEQAELGEELEP